MGVRQYTQLLRLDPFDATLYFSLQPIHMSWCCECISVDEICHRFDLQELPVADESLRPPIYFRTRVEVRSPSMKHNIRPHHICMGLAER